jgi:DNA mismatch repair protein MutS2
MLIISRHDEERLGLPQVLDACRCYSPQGRRLKAKRTFYAPSDRASLTKEFDAIESLIAFLNEHPTDVRRAAVTLGRFRDLLGTLSGLEKRRPLEVTELFEVKQALQLFRELSAMEPLLRAASVDVTAMPEAEALLDPGDRKTIGFYLYDEYSPRLAELRQQRSSIERQMESCESSQRESLLAERASLVAEEEREEAVVRTRLTGALAIYLEALKENFSAVGVLDFRLARAVLADQWGAGKPSLLGEGDSATLENMSHPVIEEDLRKRDATFVRQSVSLPPGTTVLSGPNMGGKSVALKSMTLALVLIQLGFYPSATASATPLYDFISYSSDHLDTTQRGLSTFGNEIVRIRDDAARARKGRGLVVMDEPCRGTNPEEATALVGALARFYGKQRGSFVISTHYRVPDGDGIAHVRIRGIQSEALDAMSSDGVPESDRDAIRRIEALMDYRIERVEGGAPVPTDAIRIAELLGLDEDILAFIDDVNGKSGAAKEEERTSQK